MLLDHWGTFYCSLRGYWVPLCYQAIVWYYLISTWMLFENFPFKRDFISIRIHTFVLTEMLWEKIESMSKITFGVKWPKPNIFRHRTWNTSSEHPYQLSSIWLSRYLAQNSVNNSMSSERYSNDHVGNGNCCPRNDINFVFMNIYLELRYKMIRILHILENCLLQPSVFVTVVRIHYCNLYWSNL